MSVRVGLVGTGYAADVRALALKADTRSHLLAVAGQSIDRTSAFAERHGIASVESWLDIVNDETLDLVVVATVSALHGEVAEAALNAGKHVVVEYPLSLDLAQAERLLAIASAKNLLLHVEHIELLGGLHQAMRSHLPSIGTPSYVSYRTLNPQRPAPLKWTYQPALFGFPFCGALSRVHRLTNLFGSVRAVDCCTRVVKRVAQPSFYSSILSSGRLQFASGMIAELTYGKGEGFWAARRDVEIQGSLGSLTFVRNEGLLTTVGGTQAIEVAPRKGLFVKDTKNVLAYLCEGSSLYVSSSESVYALKVSDALRRASESGQTVSLD